MHYQLIAAIDEDWGIGKDGTIPWRCPDDLKHFKRVTLGHWLVIGRKTWDSFGRKPLPGRNTIVVSSDPESVGIPPNGLKIGDTGAYRVLGARSPSHAKQLLAANYANQVFIGGGATIYSAFSAEISTIWLSRVKARAQCDTKLDVCLDNFVLLLQQGHHGDTPFTIELYRRTR